MRIIIADDHTIVRDGLKLLLGVRPDWQVVAETGEMRMVKTLAARHRPDLVILDCNMPGGHCGDTLAHLKRHHPAARVLILTAERSGAVLRHLAESGADGIVLKEGSGEALLAALDRVAAGATVVADEVRALIDDADFQITAREFQVLHLICEGWTNAAIADRFSLSVRTVDKHRENILRKMDVTNVVQLVNKTKQLGLLGSATN
jgi:DNA-binding NarL/FixJ family response regulator